jgi:two-component system OmpR family sensor kinase
MFPRALAPLVAAALGLAGALTATLSLHRAAVNAVDRVLEERLTGAGESTASLLADAEPTAARLRAVMQANGLEDAYLLNRSLRIVAGANGPSGRRADLLRLDARRVNDAFAGTASVAPGYSFGALTVLTGYFPVRRGGSGGAGGDGTVGAVLVLEAGQSFVAAHGRIARARNLGVALSVLSALALAIAAARWTRVERERRSAAARAARGEALSRVAAMAAHEIRNPLSVIRGTVDLMRERSGATLVERDRLALSDIGDEVERMRRLTQDLLDLSADRPLSLASVDLGELLAEAARSAQAAFPQIAVRCTLGALPAIEADAARLRQVFGNLLSNAAQAQSSGEIFVRARAHGDAVEVTVEDQGPGIPDELNGRLFDLYFTTKSGGTGLGLAVARRLVERHGGTLVHDALRRPGATFVVTLPLRSRGEAAFTGG